MNRNSPIQLVKTLDLALHIYSQKFKSSSPKEQYSGKHLLDRTLLCPDMRFFRPGTPYSKDRLGIQINDSSLSIHPTNCIDDLTDRLVEGKKTVLPERNPVISASMLLQLEYDSKCLPVMELFRSDGDPCI